MPDKASRLPRKSIGTPEIVLGDPDLCQRVLLVDSPPPHLLPGQRAGFAPLPNHAGPYAALLITCVGIEEAARLGLYKLNQRLLVILEKLADRQEHTTLSKADRLAMTTAHGFAHGLTHAIFLCISWLPLTLDAGTYYIGSCPQMSVFLGSALLAFAFLMLHTSSMVVAFAGAENGKPLHRFGPSAVHFIAALVTLSSFAQGGCMASAVLSLLIGASSTLCAGHVAWKSLHPSNDPA
ncbi:hypothetical protein WJX74_002756 [Apatococcus lobatus]|uniref:Uncharacterized protein n=1 Tax=Apatococcus lobatus TaxID=904363 RepID=A0AAW1RBU5_9CHLO